MKLPKLAASVSVGDDDSGLSAMILTVKRRDGQEFAFRRCTHTRRWFWRGSGFCSFRAVVKALFDIEPEGTEAAPLLDDFGAVLNQLMDQTSIYLRDKVRRLRESERSQVKEFFSEPKVRERYVYLMRHVNGLTKIGISSNPRSRERTLQAEDPRLKMLFYFQADIAVERRLHAIFQDLRVRGEWFNLEERHVEWIKFLLCKQAGSEERKS